MKRAYILCLSLLFTLPAFAQKKGEWKVEEPRGPVTEAAFTVSKGTWMNLDVSPDGKTLVFDLLGDIYTMPVSGGKAKCIASGLPYEVQPHFSPDGKRILFTSDRGGGDNIWIMDADGENKEQITKENFRLVNNSVWMPDGKYFIAKKHFTGWRSLGSGEMWMYHISGGSGMQLTKRKDDQLDVGEPCVSNDGRYVYFSEDMSDGPIFQYNKDPHGQIYMIRRYDIQEGKVENIVGGPGGAVRPQISPDGKTLAFVRRVRMQSVLYLMDLHTGEEWPIFDRLNKDQQETWATFGVYPNYDWTPDGKAIIIWAEGTFWRIDTESRAATEIPFTAEVKQTLQDAVNFPQPVHTPEFKAKMIRDAVTSPDGKTLAFNAAGHIYLKKMPKGKVERLREGEGFEYFPAFSPDGKSMAYVWWTDANRATLLIRDLKTGIEQQLSTERGFYFNPRFSPDGKMVLFEKGGGSMQHGSAFGERTGIYVTHANGGEPRRVIDHGSEAYFGPKGERIYFRSGHSFQSVNLEGEDEQTHFTSKYANQFVPSPDLEWIAFRELWNVYVAAFPKPGQSQDISAGTGAYPVFQVTRDAGTSLHWSSDSKTLHWMLGPEYFSRKVSDCFDWLADSPDSLPPVDTAGIDVGLMLKSYVPPGSIALTHARIITMKGDEVIEDGTILIRENKIAAIGPASEINWTTDANITEIDCKGKTIMPGLVDVHAHLGNPGNGLSPQQQWSYYASIAYGTTTTHDPSSNTEMVFSQAEMVRSGEMVGPRIYSTGTILYGADGDFKAVINSLDDARSHLRRLKAVGAFSVKSYNQPRRDQRQQVLQAARELQMHVYPEGGSFFNHNMTQMIDGHTGIEHSIPVSPVYEDVVKLWGASKVGYTPTLIVGYGGIWGENYWYQKTEVWKNERLLTFYPRGLIDSRSMRRMMIPDEDFGHISNAQACKAILDGGTKVQLGAHGQLHGLGAHWEMWMFVQGGFTEFEAIRASTLYGAQYIGMDKEIGSLETGKLADLIVLDANPLDDIRNSEKIYRVVANGRVFDPATMNEGGNHPRERLPFFWEDAKGAQNFDWHGIGHGFEAPHCGCFHQ